MAAFKQIPEVGVHCHSATSLRNIEILRQHGVPDSNIVFLLTAQHRSLNFNPERFNEVVEDVKKMDFDPSKTQFVIAVRALMSMSKSTWQRKMEVYEKCSWSDEETMLAFAKGPCCMTLSEEKIMALLNFYVNTWESSLIAHRPQLMSLSLGKRIIPKYSVLKLLMSKGLIKDRISAMTSLVLTDSLFFKKFVTCYVEARQLLKLYQEKLDL